MGERNWLADISRLDTEDMYGKILQFPSMVERALQISSQADPVVKNPNGVIFCGMGGSGIAPDLVKSWLAQEASVPMEVIKDYKLPGYASPNTLVCVVSYSGNTEESVSCVRDAIERKTALTTVSSGGEIESISSASGVPHIKVPPDLPPRSALPYLFIPLVKLLEVNGVISSQRISELERSVAPVRRAMDNAKVQVPIDSNRAKSLAEKLYGAFPIIYGHGVLGGVALRFRQQLNENAKMHASNNVFPELDHNELEAKWSAIGGKETIVLLRSRFESPAMKSKIDVTRDIFGSNGQALLEVRAEADTLISEALSLIARLDMASFYLALLNGVDPSSTDRINRLKEKLGSKI